VREISLRSSEVQSQPGRVIRTMTGGGFKLGSISDDATNMRPKQKRSRLRRLHDCAVNGWQVACSRTRSLSKNTCPDVETILPRTCQLRLACENERWQSDNCLGLTFGRRTGCGALEHGKDECVFGHAGGAGSTQSTKRTRKNCARWPKKEIREGHAKCQRRRGEVNVRGPRTCIPWQINSSGKARARASTNEMPAMSNHRRPLVTAAAIAVNEARAAVAASATAIAPAGVNCG
jgi:hypothetical protein